MHDLILFDVDGTLINLNPDAAELEALRSVVLERLAEAGVTPGHRGILHMYQQLICECGFDHPVSQRTRRILDKYESRWAHFRSVPLYDEKYFFSLREGQWTFGIVTSNGWGCIQTLFNEKKLQPKWFDIVVTRDDCPLLKPSPEPLRLAWNLASPYISGQAKIWYVGNSDVDYEACKAFNAWAGHELIEFAKVGDSSPLTDLQSSAGIDGFLAARLDSDA